MSAWRPKPVWAGKDAFVIGGGPSLRTFDWSRLEHEHTVGCNDAYRLGSKVCKVCVLGDEEWFNCNSIKLAAYATTALVVTNCTALKNARPWLRWMPRLDDGLYVDALGWNGNTGATAINLALLFGAQRVYLLGFDMGRTPERANWHDNQIDSRRCEPIVYTQFTRRYVAVARDWHAKFSDRELYNVTAASGLPASLIPWLDPTAFWNERTKCCEPL